VVATPICRRANSTDFVVPGGAVACPNKRFHSLGKRVFCMNFSARSVLIGLLVLLLVCEQAAFAAPPLTGSYKVTQNTSVGSQVQISLELSILNPGDSSITITSISLRSPSSPGQTVTGTTNLTIASHSTAQTRVLYTLPKSDYKVWSAGPHQQFLVNFQTHGTNKSSLATIPLVRTQG
jgi:hypothetical protein